MNALVELLVLALGVGAIIFLTVKLRVHAFLALISVSILMAIALGLPLDSIPKDIVDGFGATLGYVGLITFSATIIGELLSRTGATLVISESILKTPGEI
jgi:GntP family gluconate:H+ symporter